MFYMPRASLEGFVKNLMFPGRKIRSMINSEKERGRRVFHCSRYCNFITSIKETIVNSTSESNKNTETVPRRPRSTHGLPVHIIPLKYCRRERRLSGQKRLSASRARRSKFDQNGLQHCPWCQRDMQDVYLNPQQEPDGGVESAQPLLSERRQPQLAVHLIRTISVVSQALQPPAGLGISSSFENHGGQTGFYSFPLCPSGDDLALFHGLICHANCVARWKQHLL